MNKVHLGKNIFIKEDTWKLLEGEDKDTLYVKNLALAIWSRHALANRCIEMRDDLREITGRSPRKVVTPKKKKVLEGIYIYIYIYK